MRRNEALLLYFRPLRLNQDRQPNVTHARLARMSRLHRLVSTESTPTQTAVGLRDTNHIYSKNKVDKYNVCVAVLVVSEMVWKGGGTVD